MRKRIIGLFAIKISIIYIAFLILSAPTVATLNDKYTFGAHRGASTRATENTMEAFEIALNDSKYEFIEFDIQFTEDREIIVMHTNNKYRIPKEFIDGGYDLRRNTK